jgi:hypothetical protein
MITTQSPLAIFIIIVVTTVLKTLWWTGVIAAGIVVSRFIKRGNS